MDVHFSTLFSFKSSPNKHQLSVTCLSGFMHRLILRMIESQRVHICLVWHRNSWRRLLQFCQHCILMLFVAVSIGIQSCSGDHRGNIFKNLPSKHSNIIAETKSQGSELLTYLHSFFKYKIKVEEVLHWLLTFAWATA